MEEQYGILAIIGICVLVLTIGIMKQKAKGIVVVISRVSLGIIGICIVNEMLKTQGLNIAVGVNPVSTLTIGTLGISGFALLYGILLYRLL
ncbi:MAG: pro-sigmaK processing inhibitor BofA family protein [Lachnospiraceae bacterium]